MWSRRYGYVAEEHVIVQPHLHLDHIERRDLVPTLMRPRPHLVGLCHDVLTRTWLHCCLTNVNQQWGRKGGCHNIVP